MNKENKLEIKTVSNKNIDFIKLCKELDNVHNTIVAEQRAANSNCLFELDIYKNVYVMYYNEQAVGCIAFTDVINGNIEIGRVYVREEYRNQGIATKIFDKVLKSSIEKGANSLILDTYERLEDAVRLYKKWGFKLVPQFDNLKDSPYSICMKKNLKD